MDEFEREWAALLEKGLETSSLRREYVEKVRGLKALADRLRSEGQPPEQIARTLHEERRELGRQYKQAAPPLFREYIYYATAGKYGDPLGPGYETLRERKSPEEIIESASRPIADLGDRLSLEGFRRWYTEKKAK